MEVNRYNHKSSGHLLEMTQQGEGRPITMSEILSLSNILVYTRAVAYGGGGKGEFPLLPPRKGKNERKKGEKERKRGKRKKKEGK